MKIQMRLDPESIGEGIAQVEAYQKRVAESGDKIAQELAYLGYQVAYGVMSGHVFSGETSESLEVVEDGPNRYILMAASRALLFFEFGAGARQGGGHPWDDDFGFGPGTYPGNGHWDDPMGWWFPTEDPRLIIRRDKSGQGWGHSYGNKPHMPFYRADKAMRDDLLKVAKEVLRGGGTA